MANFTYVGRDRSGNQQTGAMEADTASAVAQRLSQMGVVPIKIDQTAVAPSASKASFGRGVSALEVLMFCRQMNTLLKAGVPILRALGGLVESTVHKHFARIINDVKESLQSGLELSQALAQHPKVFPDFMIAMVRVGESSGRLDEIFLRLFHHFEFQKFMREQVKSALRYPTFVVLAMAIAMVVINIWVIPAFAKTFKGLNAELPLMTKVLIGTSDFVVTAWPLLLVAVVGAVFGFRIFVQTEKGGYTWDRFKMSLPIAGKIIRKATLARLCRSLGIAIQSGVSIVQAMGLVQPVVENRYVASKLDQMRLGVAGGESVLRVATASGVFTPTVLQMIMVGEESGALDEMMSEVADMYQRDVEYELKSLSAQIEPILLLFLGGIVLVLALGIFMPMWDMGRAMGGS